MTELIAQAQSLALTYGLRLIGAIVILLVGRWLARYFSQLTRTALDRAQLDKTLIRFLGSLVYVGILVVAVIAALNQVGVQSTSLVAIVGAAGLAIGLALEGALANFAAGTLILVLRPFRVGERVEVADVFGRVEEIQIFNTILVTPDNKTVIVPNAQVTGSPIVNYSRRGLLRLDLTFGIGYNDDIQLAKQILEEIVAADERVVAEPAAVVAVRELADSSVNFAVWPYVQVDDVWPVRFAITEQVKQRFDAAGISIPFPQRDVHLFPAPVENGS